MACSVDEKTKVLNFPSPEFLDSLISSFPCEWQGVFGALNTGNNPVKNATYWMEEKVSDSAYKGEIPPNWSRLCEHLTGEFPLVLKENIYFKPKVLLLPLSLQRNVLSLILHCADKIPLICLKKLEKKLGDFDNDLQDWTSSLKKLLKLKIKELESLEAETIDSQTVYFVDVITEKSKPRFQDLCDRIQKSTRSVGVDEIFGTLKWVAVEENSMDKLESSKIQSSSTIFKPENVVSVLRNPIIDQNNEKFARARNLLMAEPMDIDLTGDDITEITEPLKIQESEVIEIDASPIKRHKVECKGNEDAKLLVPVPQPPEPTPEIDEGAVIVKELRAKAEPLQNFIQNLAESMDPNAHADFGPLAIFIELSSNEVEEICSFVGLQNISEQLACTLCQHFVALPTEPSYMNACVFASHCILPRLSNLKQAASRILTGAVTSFGRKYPKAFCDGALHKLLADTNFNSYQADLISKSIKDNLSCDGSRHLFSLLLNLQTNSDGYPFQWSEDIVSVVQTVVDCKIELNQEQFNHFVKVLELNSVTLSKSLKFAKLLLAVINKYRGLVALHHNVFLQILERNETFLKKAGMAAVKKLR